MALTLMPMPLQIEVGKKHAARAPAVPIQPKVRFIKPADPRGEGAPPTGNEPDATELVFGFWDNAMEVITAPGGQSTRALNDEEAEPRNLVGGDSRRFHITVEDPGAAGKGFVDADWWSAYSESDQRMPGVVQDDPHSIITLLETKAGSGIFVSKGLMLVNDSVDRNIEIHSGISTNHPDPKLAAHGGVRRGTKPNFRIRRAGMHGFGVAQYRSKAMKVTAVVPVFSVASRRRIEVQVYVLRDKAGGKPSVPVVDIARTDLRIVTETYERHGVWLFTKISPADLIPADFTVTGPKIHVVGSPDDDSPVRYTILEVDPPKRRGDAKVSEADMDEIARTFPALPNTLRLVFVEDILVQGDGVENVLGISYDGKPEPFDPDYPMHVPRGVPATTLGTSFVRRGRDPYTAAHELGHLLMPKTANKGHYSQRLSTSAPGERHIQDLNLMGVIEKEPREPCLHTKRIWDLEDRDSYGQLVSLSLSPYLRR